LFYQNTIKVELNNKRSSTKYRNNWRLSNMLLHNQWITEEIREEIKIFLEFSENQNTTYQNLWDTAKAFLKGKLIAMGANIKNTEMQYRISNSYKNNNKLNQNRQKERKNKNKGQSQ
jgi:hypothetical protein